MMIFQHRGTEEKSYTEINTEIMIKDEKGRVATITISDVNQSNGVIHVINSVLLPA